MPYIDTYYRRTLVEDAPRPPLAGEVEADVCIVGAGLAGLTAALHLVRAGRSVVVLEAERVAWGASGRNGGFVSPGYATSHEAIARRVGEERARDLHRLSIEGMEIVRRTIEELRIDVAKPSPGIMRAIRRDAGDELRRLRDRLARDYAYEVAFMETPDVREVLLSKKYFQALHDTNAFHFHPLNYARALAAEIERLGGAIHEESRVLGVDLDKPQKKLRTALGRVLARDVVFACGGYTAGVVPELARSHLPIATYVLLTEKAPEKIARAIRTRSAVGDDRRAGDYYRLVDEGERILWGGRITTRTSEPRQLAEMLRRTMVSTYPQLSGLKVEIAWSGLMSYARHLMPQIGRLREGVWYCMGFGGHGMNTTAIGGRVVAEAIFGTSDRIRLFEPYGLVWNGGPFGLAAAQLTYWAYQAQDYWRERRAPA